MSAKRVLITGCSSGIGRATALELAKRGHHVVATARRPEVLTDLDVARVSELDVTSDESVQRALAQAGEVDVLVNNAGVGLRGPVELVAVDLVRRVFEVNVFGVLRVTQAVLPGMRARGSGTIVNVSSVAGRRSMPLVGLYAASKHALEAFSEALRWEVGPMGVHVVLVEPAVVNSRFADSRVHVDVEGTPYEDLGQRAREAMAANLRDPTLPEHVATVIADAVEADQPALRYHGTPDAAGLVAQRTELDDAGFEAWMRQQLGYEE